MHIIVFLWVNGLQQQNSAFESVIFQRKQEYSDCQLRSLLLYVTGFSETHIKRMRQQEQYLNSTGLGNNSHFARCYWDFKGAVSRTLDLIARWHQLACPITDLNPCDFFSKDTLVLEDKVCNHRFQSLEEMKNAINKEIAAIPPEMIANYQNFTWTSLTCVASYRTHQLKNLIFKATWNKMAWHTLR